MALPAAMTMLRVGVAVIVISACSVESGDGTTSFGSAGMDTSGPPPASDESTAAGSSSSEGASEAGDEGPQSSSESGSTSDGSTTDPGGSEATSGGSSTGAPIGEHDYGPCTGGDPKAPCGEDAECLVIEGFEGSFCSPWCDEDLACPDPTSGEAFAQCQLGPDLSMDPIHCALLCTPGSEECPGGMTCVETGMPVGVCLFQG